MRKSASLFVAMCLCPAALVWGQAKKSPVHKTAAPEAAKPAASKSAIDKPAIEAYLRQLFMIPPNIRIQIEDPRPSELPPLMQVMVKLTDGGPMKQQVEFLVSGDGSKILQGKIFDTRQRPFADDLRLLKTEGLPSAGPPGAPVTLVVFSDFECPHCKEEAKTLRANLEKEYPTQARLVFKDFPLEQIHPWAKQAAAIGRCIQKLDAGAFWQFHDWIFDQQTNIKPETLRQQALGFLNGKVDTLQLTQCMDGKLTEKDVESSIADAHALEITSTPTLFVNGRRMVGNIPWDQLKRVIDWELDYAKKNPLAKQDEACCELKLAIPGVK
jgi:protein-disulfide isomerase